MKESNCFNCTKRHIGCHATCLDYITYKINNEDRKRKIAIGKKSMVEFLGYKKSKIGVEIF